MEVRQPLVLAILSDGDLYSVWLFRPQIPFIPPQVQVFPHHSQLTVTTFLRSSLAMQENQEYLMITGANPGSMCLYVVGSYKSSPKALQHKWLVTLMSLTCTCVTVFFFFFRVEYQASPSI